MLNRLKEKNILDWIVKSKKALLVSGARQVGKTFLIRKCLEKNNCHSIEINLIDRSDIIPVFSQSKTLDELVENLQAILDVKFYENKTILFIDEVQECPDIITKIKFWVDDGRYRFILSGSLLGVELNNLRSAPVGYLREVKMYPLDFKEFLQANGVTEDTIEMLENSYSKRMPLNESVNDRMLSFFYKYLVVGGMPEVVWEYVNNKDLAEVMSIQNDIINFYKRDFTKYETIDKRLSLISIFEQIPSQLLKQNKRFNYADIKKGLRFERIESSFLWMTYAGVSVPVYNATEPRIALNQNRKSSLLKLYSSDVGLLTCQYGKGIRDGLLIRDDKINLGGLFENAVVQQLNSKDFDLYYYNSRRMGELDLVIEKDGKILPIEIKSGKDYYVHSAISNVIKNTEYDIEEAFVLANCNIEKKGKITYLPVYMSGFIS